VCSEPGMEVMLSVRRCRIMAKSSEMRLRCALMGAMFPSAGYQCNMDSFSR
jgi:hypothetical protein